MQQFILYASQQTGWWSVYGRLELLEENLNHLLRWRSMYMELCLTIEVSSFFAILASYTSFDFSVKKEILFPPVNSHSLSVMASKIITRQTCLCLNFCFSCVWEETERVTSLIFNHLLCAHAFTSKVDGS